MSIGEELSRVEDDERGSTVLPPPSHLSFVRKGDGEMVR